MEALKGSITHLKMHIDVRALHFFIFSFLSQTDQIQVRLNICVWIAQFYQIIFYLHYKYIFQFIFLSYTHYITKSITVIILNNTVQTLR